MKNLFLLFCFVLLAACAGKENDQDDVVVSVPVPKGSLTINGVTWASVNVDDYQTFAEKPDMHTKFYQWNRSMAWGIDTITLDEWLLSGSDSLSFWVLANDDGYIIPNYPKGREYWVDTAITDAAWTINPCPEGWRLPTPNEFEELNNSGFSYAEVNERGNSVAGRFYGANASTCSLPDSIGGCIFIAASGQRHYLNGYLLMGSGHYWSSEQHSFTLGRCLAFNQTGQEFTGRGNKSYGLNVRCVLK